MNKTEQKKQYKKRRSTDSNLLPKILSLGEMGHCRLVMGGGVVMEVERWRERRGRRKECFLFTHFLPLTTSYAVTGKALPIYNIIQ